MRISTKGRYALRILIDMAEHQTTGYMPLQEIARRQEISEKYLENLAKNLVKGGILEGLRGKGGGYRLKRRPESCTVGDILRLSEGPLSPVACLEPDSAPCPRMSYCRTLPMWQGLDKVITEYLDSVTLADLMRSGQSGNDYVI